MSTNGNNKNSSAEIPARKPGSRISRPLPDRAQRRQGVAVDSDEFPPELLGEAQQLYSRLSGLTGELRLQTLQEHFEFDGFIGFLVQRRRIVELLRRLYVYSETLTRHRSDDFYKRETDYINYAERAAKDKLQRMYPTSPLLAQQQPQVVGNLGLPKMGLGA